MGLGFRVGCAGFSEGAYEFRFGGSWVLEQWGGRFCFFEWAGGGQGLKAFWGRDLRASGHEVFRVLGFWGLDLGFAEPLPESPIPLN